MSTEYYTVVYRVEGDKAQHDAWWQGIRPLFLAEGPPPISIVCITKGDLVARVDELETQAEGAASNRFYDQRDAYFEGLDDGKHG